MIKDQMDLALSVDTATLKATIDAYNQTDEKINAYSVGFIPWEMVEESTFFNWSMYHFEKAGSACEISPASWPYDSGVVESVDRGVPFCYVLGIGGHIPSRYVYKDVVIGDWLVRGTLEQDGYMAFSSAHNGYDIALFQGEKYLIHTLDLQNVVTNVRNATFTSYIAIAISVFNEDYSKAGIAVCTGAQYDPIADTISSINVTVMDTVHSVTFSYAFNSEKFKQIGKTGFSEDVTTGGYTYHIFAYIVGIHQYCSVDGNYLSAFIADGLPFRVSATYGYIDINTNLSPYSVLTDTPQPLISTNEGRYASIGLSRVSWMDTINGDRWANVLYDNIPTDSFSFADGQSQVNENGNMRILSSISLGYWFKSYTYTDVKISALTCTPIIKQGTKYYCPEYDENYALTGNWVEYTNQNLNPDINEFDPSDIPGPTPPGEDDTQWGGVDYLVNNTYPIGSTNGFITLYALTESQMSSFGQYLWADFFDSDFWDSILVTLGESASINPADILNYIPSVKYYPMNLSSLPNCSSTGSSDIYIGRGIKPITLTGNVYSVNSFSTGKSTTSDTITPHYGDFRDYEPCTRLVLFVPFCGIMELTPSQVMGGTIKLDYVFDFSTGGCECAVSVQHPNFTSMIDTLSGTIGANIEMTASNLTQVISSFGKAAIGITTNIALAALGVGEANAASEVGGKAAQAESTLQSTQSSMVTNTGSDIGSLLSLNGVPQPHMGHTGGFSSFIQLNPIIQRTCRHYEIPDNYAHVYGYACNYSTTLENLKGKGYTVCKNVDLEGVPATQDELALIEQLLQSGVYF